MRGELALWHKQNQVYGAEHSAFSLVPWHHMVGRMTSKLQHVGSLCLINLLTFYVMAE